MYAGDGDDAAFERDLRPGAPARIAAAVEPLVVGEGDVGDEVQVP